MSESNRVSESWNECRCNADTSSVNGSIKWKKRLDKFCGCNDCANLFNKCLDRTALSGDIIDHFNRHAMTIDDNLLNCIHDFYVSINDHDLVSFLDIEEKIIYVYKQIVKDVTDRKLLPFSRVNNSLRMHGVMVEKCQLSSILYEEDGKSMSDFRTLWNDTRLDYYIYNNLIVDVKSIIKIYIKNRLLSDDVDAIDIEGFMSMMVDRGVRLCDHINASILRNLFDDIDNTISGVNKEMKDLSIQVNLSMEDKPLVKQRSLRPRK